MALPAGSAPGEERVGAGFDAVKGIDEQDALRQLAAPMGVRLRLADGATIAGVVTAWSDRGLVGSFGYRRWADVRPAEARELYLRLMDRSDPEAWVRMGGMLLRTKGGAGLAEQAFRRARAMAPEVGELVAQAREAAAEDRAQAPATDTGRLRLDEPESRSWSATPWRALSVAERDAAVEILKEDAAAVLSLAGLGQMRPVESDRLLLYWNAPRDQVAQLAIQLERTIEWLSRLLAIDGRRPEFWGKALVIVVDDRAEFRRLQQRVFLQADRPDRTAMCHCIGEKVVVAALSGGRGDDLLARLAREMTFGVLHRHISPRRLPPWANEGLAELAAFAATRDHYPLEARRRSALRALREGLDVASVLGASYGDPAWPGPPGESRSDAPPVGPALGALALQILEVGRPSPFAAWVADVKRGEDWRESFGRRYRTSIAALAKALAARHRFAD